MWVRRANLGMYEFIRCPGAKVLERLADWGKTASQWYAELPGPESRAVTGQLREFNLTAIEAVDPGLRAKYAKIYRNY